MMMLLDAVEKRLNWIMAQYVYTHVRCYDAFEVIIKYWIHVHDDTLVCAS